MYYKIGVEVVIHLKKKEVKYFTLHINFYTTNYIKYVNLIKHKVKLIGVKIIKYRRYPLITFYSVWLLRVPILMRNFVVNKFNSNLKWHIFTDIILQDNAAYLFSLVTKKQRVGGGNLFIQVNGVLKLNKHCVNIVLCSEINWYPKLIFSTIVIF